MTYRNPVTKPIHAQSWIRPAGNRDFRVVRGFGDMSVPQYGPHNGVDLGDTLCGSVVVAADAGVVDYAAADPNSGGANIVIVRHPIGERTWYAHLASIAVRRGQTVAAGAKLGTVGATGWASQCHLHFQRQRRNSTGGWQDVDPLPILALVERALPLPDSSVEVDPVWYSQIKPYPASRIVLPAGQPTRDEPRLSGDNIHAANPDGFELVCTLQVAGGAYYGETRWFVYPLNTGGFACFNAKQVPAANITPIDEADCSALEAKVARAATAVDGAAQAVRAAQVALS